MLDHNREQLPGTAGRTNVASKAGREERHLMRIRGAGPRAITAGFDFGFQSIEQDHTVLPVTRLCSEITSRPNVKSASTSKKRPKREHVRMDACPAPLHSPAKLLQGSDTPLLHRPLESTEPACKTRRRTKANHSTRAQVSSPRLTHKGKKVDRLQLSTKANASESNPVAVRPNTSHSGHTTAEAADYSSTTGPTTYNDDLNVTDEAIIRQDTSRTRKISKSKQKFEHDPQREVLKTVDANRQFLSTQASQACSSNMLQPLAKPMPALSRVSHRTSTAEQLDDQDPLALDELFTDLAKAKKSESFSRITVLARPSAKHRQQHQPRLKVKTSDRNAPSASHSASTVRKVPALKSTSKTCNMHPDDDEMDLDYLITNIADLTSRSGHTLIKANEVPQ